MNPYRMKFLSNILLSYLLIGSSATFADVRIEEMQTLAAHKRYDHIVTLSLYQMTQPACQSECRIRAGLNAIRGSILLGDTDGALLLATHFLNNLPEQPQAPLGWQNKINFLTIYSHGLNGDQTAVQHQLKNLEVNDQFRLLRLFSLDAPFIRNESLTQPAQSQHYAFQKIGKEEEVAWKKFRAIPVKSPWVAGLSNLVLPGAGYAYLGMWQTAALSALLTGVCIGSAIELYQHRLYASGAAMAMVGSVFYMGGALGASRSANDINQKNRKETTQSLRSILLPELTFEF
jgi:hypothetical protein